MRKSILKGYCEYTSPVELNKTLEPDDMTQMDHSEDIIKDTETSNQDEDILYETGRGPKCMHIEQERALKWKPQHLKRSFRHFKSLGAKAN